MSSIGISVAKAACVLTVTQTLFVLRRLDDIAVAHVSVSLNRGFAGDLMSTCQRSTALHLVLEHIDACFIVVILMNIALWCICLAIEFAIFVSSSCCLCPHADRIWFRARSMMRCVEGVRGFHRLRVARGHILCA
jgi:hypothetical protein